MNLRASAFAALRLPLGEGWGEGARVESVRSAAALDLTLASRESEREGGAQC